MSNWITRKKTKSVNVGGVLIGDDNPIAVQSMTNTDTNDVLATVKQINDLQASGADIVRVSVPSFDEAAAFKEIKKAVNIPLVADIHFDYKIALEIADSADCLRINPGNIGKEKKVQEVIQAAIHNNVPIRVGVNAGSLEKDLQKKYGEPNADALVESALRHVDILDKFNFENYGFFNFKKISSIDIFNKWSISIPEGSNVSIQTLQDGEKITSGNNSLKVTEIFRNYGVNSELRNFWPLIYVNETLYWIVGLRKSDEAIKNEKKYKSNILVASVEKSSFED
jgi:tRNA(Ile)-lysidine synthetase-like protein